MDTTTTLKREPAKESYWEMLKLLFDTLGHVSSGVGCPPRGPPTSTDSPVDIVPARKEDKNASGNFAAVLNECILQPYNLGSFW